MLVCGWGGAWGVDGGWMPLPTRPQRYCETASLVLFIFVVVFHVVVIDEFCCSEVNKSVSGNDDGE